MAKATKTASGGIEEKVREHIVAFLKQTTHSDMLPRPHTDSGSIQHRYYRVYNWDHEGEHVQQAIALENDAAQRFFEVKELVSELIFREAGHYELMPEKYVAVIVGECCAKKVWHENLHGQCDVDALVADILKSTLFAPKQSFTVCLPVYGLWINEPRDFLGIHYQSPASNSDYMRIVAIHEHAGGDGSALHIGDEAVSGKDVLATVQCEARYADEAILVAEREVSRSLQIMFYSAMREFRGASHLRVPGVIERKRQQPSLSVVAYNAQGQGQMRPAASTVAAEAPMNVNALSSSAWYEELQALHEASSSSGKIVGSGLLDALFWLGRSLAEEQSATKLLFQITALECLLPISTYDEKVHQVTLLSSVLAGIVNVDRDYVYRLVRRAYSIRSKVVHGSKTSTSRYESDRVGPFLDRVVDYLLFNDAGKQVLEMKPDDWRDELMSNLFR